MSVTACECAALGVTRPVDRRLGIPHCTTCHRDWHFACDVCGACLPEWVPNGIPKHTPSGRDNRIDRHYCSNACRQKAYRQRQRELVAS